MDSFENLQVMVLDRPYASETIKLLRRLFAEVRVGAHVKFTTCHPSEQSSNVEGVVQELFLELKDVQGNPEKAQGILLNCSSNGNERAVLVPYGYIKAYEIIYEKI